MSEFEFQLPTNVFCERKTLSDGSPAWYLIHADFGQLGRITTQPAPGNQCQLNYEIAGDPDDPMMGRRKEIFGPVVEMINEQLLQQLGNPRNIGTPLPVRPRPTSESHLIPSKFMQCKHCGEFYAHLVFADQARTPGDIEDIARLAFSMIKQANLPTWIIGAPMERPVPADSSSMVLKVWPDREDLRRLTPDEFELVLDEVQKTHCKPGGR